MKMSQFFTAVLQAHPDADIPTMVVRKNTMPMFRT